MNYQKTLNSTHIIEISVDGKENAIFTGFFFDQEHLLTVGHPFKDIDLSKAVIKIKINDELKIDAECIEYKYIFEKDERIDFCILKSKNYKNKNHLNLGIPKKINNIDCTLLGYPSDGNGDPRVGDVKIVFSINKSNNFYQISIKDNHKINLQGMSGSPYVAGNDEVVAIQTHIHSSDDRPFGISIESIVLHSQFFGKHYYLDLDSYKKTNSIAWFFLKNERVDIPIKSKNNAKDPRWSLLISDEYGQDLRQELVLNWERSLINEINKAIKSSFKDPKAINKDTLKLNEARTLFLSEKNPIMSAIKEALSPYSHKQCRVIIDPLNIGTEDDEEWINFSKENISHTISITSKKEDKKSNIFKINNFDQSFEIGTMDRTPQYFANCVLNIIMDSYIDRYIYYKYNFFQNICNDPKLNFNYSKQKAIFAYKSKKPVYGNLLSSDEVNYISLASLCRSSVDNSYLDTMKLLKMIEEFTKFLLNTVFQSSYAVLEQTSSTIGVPNKNQKEEIIRTQLGKVGLHKTSSIEVNRLQNISKVLHLFKFKNFIHDR